MYVQVELEDKTIIVDRKKAECEALLIETIAKQRHADEQKKTVEGYVVYTHTCVYMMCV